MTNKDKVFAQNWIEQMRTEFGRYSFSKYTGQPLTYVFESYPHTLVNCFWWNSELPWGRRENALLGGNLVR